MQNTVRKPYDSDVTDAEWALIRPLLPPASALRKRSDGASAGDRQCGFLYQQTWLCLAWTATRFAQVANRLWIFSPVCQNGSVGTDK